MKTTHTFLITACIWSMASPAVTSGQPANDNFAEAMDLGSAFPLVMKTSNVDATVEDDESFKSRFYAFSSLWWKWTAPADGLYEVNSLGSDANTLIDVFTGSTLGALTDIKLLSDANAGETDQSIAIFEVSGGSTVLIRLSGREGNSGQGDIRLEIRGGSFPRYFMDELHVFDAPEYGLSGWFETDGTKSSGRADSSEILDWEILVNTPGQNDGIQQEILTPANSSFSFYQATSEGRMTALESFLRISGSEHTSLRSTLTLSGSDASIQFYGSSESGPAEIVIEDTSESTPVSRAIRGEGVHMVLGVIQPYLEAEYLMDNRVLLRFKGTLETSDNPATGWTEPDRSIDPPAYLTIGEDTGFFRARAIYPDP